MIFATDLVRGGGVGGRMLQRYQGWRGKKGREWEGEEEIRDMNKDALAKDTSNAVLAFKEALQSARKLLRFGSEGCKFYMVCFSYSLLLLLLFSSFFCTTESSFSSNNFKATYTRLFLIFLKIFLYLFL